jgi:hypothetical protein
MLEDSLVVLVEFPSLIAFLSKMITLTFIMLHLCTRNIRRFISFISMDSFLAWAYWILKLFSEMECIPLCTHVLA